MNLGLSHCRVSLSPPPSPPAPSMLHFSQVSKAPLFSSVSFTHLNNVSCSRLWPRLGLGLRSPRSAQLCSHPWTLTSCAGSWCIAVYTGAASFLCKLWCPSAMSKKPSDTPISALTCPFLWPARLLPANTYPHRLPANPAAPRACQSPPPCLLPLHRLLLPLPPHLAPGVSF